MTESISADSTQPASLKDAFGSGRPLACSWFALGSAALVEVALQARPDCIVLDRQHGLWERLSMEAAIGVARQRMPVIVRCAENSPLAISEALDAGAASVLIPLVESAHDTRRAVSSGRYAPLGTRSAGGMRPLLGGIEAMLESGSRVSVGVMIETVAGVEQAEAIAAVEGLDYLFIGTGDLALSRGRNAPGSLEQDCQRVLCAARSHGLACGIFSGDSADALAQLAKGFDLVVAANDIETARAGFAAAHDALRAAAASPADPSL
jgi:2-keto-3-deoxy-L-rhamnonate aldolase RhmA